MLRDWEAFFDYVFTFIFQNIILFIVFVLMEDSCLSISLQLFLSLLMSFFFHAEKVLEMLDFFDEDNRKVPSFLKCSSSIIMKKMLHSFIRKKTFQFVEKVSQTRVFCGSYFCSFDLSILDDKMAFHLEISF